MSNVCVITSTRADYSLLKPLLSLIKQNENMNLQLVVTGSHLSAQFGNTYKAIEKDEFEIAEKIFISCDDSKQGVGNAMGLACIGFTAAFERLRPDILALLGDRYEIFIAAGIATVFRIPIAHIHGGEVTTGAIDDAFRHSITKMSTLHFTAAQDYKNRVIQMGANPDFVFCTGSLAVDSVKSIELLSKKDTEKKLGLNFDKQTLLFTYHPETLSQLSVEQQADEVFLALEQLEDVNIILTKANADAGGVYINSRIDDFLLKHPDLVVVRDSLGQLLYYSTMKYCDAVVGNSSSGVLETPIFKKPTVNIGNRQNGRIMAENVISVGCEHEAIINAIHMALSQQFKAKVNDIVNPFECENAALRILEELENYFIYCPIYQTRPS